ncbi:peptidoglycan recognition protein family protein [Helicobacter didelphidarum]|uniref:peptidoglycan recognition protein family protein n=1 Tax=Helicobacter didelphidarum TaxID=2040648 RepID=UPI0015F1B269|nr:peptidoglycan recognition family protein [Helicobacter didelphidarum]
MWSKEGKESELGREFADCEIEDGYIKGLGIIKQPKPKLVEETGSFNKPPIAIVLHRTNSPTAKSTLNHWDTSLYGAHFLIDKDGTIYQCASLHQWTQHVGDIRSRVEVEKTWDTNEKMLIENMWKEKTSYSARKTKVSNYEKKKPYPNRYPISSDSIGIEVVGEYDDNTKRYPNATLKQLGRLEQLVRVLFELYHINKTDLYAHAKIAYKDTNSTEGVSLLEYLRSKL